MNREDAEQNLSCAMSIGEQLLINGAEVSRVEDTEPQYSLGPQVLIYAWISGSFSLFFGGNTKDMAASAFIGVLLKFLETMINKTPVNTLITALLCSIAGGFCANVQVLWG